MKMLIDRAIVEQAVEACEQRLPLVGQATIIDELNALRAALEQEQAETVQEPVAWRYKPMIGSPWSLSDDGYYISCKRDKGYAVEPLYTVPPQHKK